MTEKILLLSPFLNRFGTRHADGEMLYLGQFLFNKGFTVKLFDNYLFGSQKEETIFEGFEPDTIIVHMASNELLIESSICKLLDFLLVVKRRLRVAKIIGIGSLATSLHEEIFTYNEALDDVIAEGSVFPRNNHSQSRIPELLNEYYRNGIILTDDYLIQSNLKFDALDVVPVFSSRGCLNRCSFCAYNSNIVGWKERSIDDLVTDIKTINRMFNCNKFAFFDNNFGFTCGQNETRSELLATAISSLNFALSLSLNISCSGLNRIILHNFKRASVKGILIGLESLNQETLCKVYNKPQDVNHCRLMIEHIEQLGMVPIISYILFQPWLRLSQLKEEVERIEHFGRHRIIQFFSKSKLQVIPNTAIEHRLIREKLLVKGLLSREFIFEDSAVGVIHKNLKLFFSNNFSRYNKDLLSLTEFKIKEWEYLKILVKRGYNN